MYKNLYVKVMLTLKVPRPFFYQKALKTSIFVALVQENRGNIFLGI